MEMLAYLQLAQEQESPAKELKLEAFKMTGTVLGAAGAALAVGAIASAPVYAHDYGYDKGHDYGYEQSYGCGGGGCGATPILLVPSYRAYEVSFSGGCGGWGGGWDSGCGGGGDYYSYGGYDGGYDGGYYGGGGCGGGWESSCGSDWGGCGGSVGWVPVAFESSDCGCGGGGDYYGYGGYEDYGYEDYGYEDYGHGGGCGGDYCDVGYGFSAYDIQVALTHAGFHVSVDGVFGAETDAAVRAFQIASGLAPDGVVGPATASALGL